MRGLPWKGAPTWVRWTVATYVVLLSYGTVLHLVDLAAGGVEPYPWAPPWLALYLVLLTVLDPLAAGLLALRRRAGLYLACTVFVTERPPTVMRRMGSTVARLWKKSATGWSP